MNIQKMMDGLNDMMQQSRSGYHLTLGNLIDFLEKREDKNNMVVYDFGDKDCEWLYPTNPHSYRGYYSDLAFETSDTVTTILDFVNELKKSLNKEFTGYKGGQFIMHENTPLWVADYGCTGKAIVDIKIHEDGYLVLVTKCVD